MRFLFSFLEKDDGGCGNGGGNGGERDFYYGRSKRR